MPTAAPDADSRPTHRRVDEGAFGVDLPPYKTRPWLFSGRLQTAAVPLAKVRRLHREFASRRLIVPLDDGSGDRTDVYHYWPPGQQPWRSGRPVVLLVHGLGGHSHSAYVTCSAAALLDAGYEVLMPNFRGAGTSRDLAGTLHHPGRSEDLDLILRGLAETAPESDGRDLFAVGFSLGGHLLLKFLADLADAPDPIPQRLTMAVTASAPLSLDTTSQRLDEWPNWPFNRYLLHKIKSEIVRPLAILSDRERAIIDEVRSVREIDQRLTAPRLGYDDAPAYYRANSAIEGLSEIALPTLLIHSLDDPFVADADYEHPDIEANPHLQTLLLPDGGHVGFFSGQSGSRWIDRALIALLQAKPWETEQTE